MNTGFDKSHKSSKSKLQLLETYSKVRDESNQQDSIMLKALMSYSLKILIYKYDGTGSIQNCENNTIYDMMYLICLSMYKHTCVYTCACTHTLTQFM